MPVKPRPYQTECVSAILKEWKNGCCRQLVSLPTGTGKTIVFALLAKKLGIPTLVLAHREELLSQAKAKIKMVDPSADVGILKASTLDGLSSHICVASVQTAIRPNRLKELKEKDFKLLIIDEAHHVLATNTYGSIIKELGFMDDDKEKLLVGVTATAFRGDGVALGGVFDKITFERTILAMIKGGYLSDARGISVKTHSDLSNVHTHLGDFAINELSLAINNEDRNKLIVESYKKQAADRKAIVFCCDIKHSQDLAEAFKAGGVNAEAVWGAMDGRHDTLADFARGNTKVVCNCNVLTEGFDDPSTSAILLARPTKSRVLYCQMVGRGLRLAPDKHDCLVMDFADTAGHHSLCSLASLSGSNPKFKVKQGQLLTEAIENVEASDVWKRETLGDISQQEIELFEQSHFVWTPVIGGHYKLQISEEETLWIRKIPMGYASYVLAKGADKALPLSDIVLPLGYAQGEAEDYARRNGKNMILVDRTAKWRKGNATPKQLATLTKWKIPFAEGISRGDASQLLAIEIEKRNAKNNGPASSRQLYFIRSKLGIPVSSTLTFLEARKMIAEHNRTKETAISA